MIVRIRVEEKGRGLYDAYLGSGLVCRSRTPFFTSARRLLDLGFDEGDTLEMTRDGERVDMRGSIGGAAKLSVSEPSAGSSRIKKFEAREFADPESD